MSSSSDTEYCEGIKKSDIDNVLTKTDELTTTVKKAVTYAKNITDTANGTKAEKARQNTLKILANKLKKATNNYNLAPEELKNAEKNYYEFKEGPVDYNNLLLSRYEKSAGKIKKKSIINHKSHIKELNTLQADYEAETLYKDRMSDLLNKLVEENRILRDALDKEKGASVTNDRKTWYEDQQTNKIKSYTPILKGLYFVLLIAYIIFGGYIERKEYKDWKIWLMIGIYILFPFILYWFVVQLFALYRSLSDFYKKKGPKNVYLNLAKP